MIFLVVADYGYDGIEVCDVHRDLTVALMDAETRIGLLWSAADADVVVPWYVEPRMEHPFSELEGPTWHSVGARDYPTVEYVVVAAAVRG